MIDTIAKLFAKLLLDRFAPERNLRVRPNQGGFRPGMGCVDQIFTLRRILEHRSKYQQPTSACFIDFKTAFDSVDRISLWQIMAADGVPIKLLNLIKAYYVSTTARVRAYGEESEGFNLSAGVRQGCPLSPMLFNYAIDWILERALPPYRGVQLSDDLWIADLEYADDVVLLGAEPASLQPVLERIARYAADLGLSINPSKTKLMSTFIGPVQPIVFNGEAIQQVSEFSYLGSLTLPNGQAKAEVTSRIAKARAVFGRLCKCLWSRSEIGMKTKMLVYSSSVRPVLLYGCETWPVRSVDSEALEVFDHWCLRKISRVAWQQRATNQSVRERCSNIRRLSDVVRQRRLQWFGHLLRKPSETLTLKALNMLPCPDWRCRTGGQVKTWIKTIQSDVELLGLAAVYGLRRWRKDWISIGATLACDRRA